MGYNKKNLRAWVRRDGMGRVVSSSVILRVNKPKVGDWFEIPTYECCDPLQIVDTTTTSTTSTTTTIA